ncbi:baculoviral IAP repeat-containing protein 7-like isoform X2 [Leptotrombidium deliense]|uniref:Baculoviral IAP repeat-containing protein 7-like isoform X2 n=1 Tax=Leptotrombidium deliense TaxID=299467 RepID=A0A443SEX1_9ACAR|nr:baculoviral IAP repeat-containing protein 7-like isoform X2 [Leptotrombidium deliense]
MTKCGKNESARETASKVWKRADVCVEKLDRAGFYYSGIGNAVRCFVCNEVLRNWVDGDDPINEPKLHS